MEQIVELAQRLQCNTENPDEMESLRLALQLEAEEREEQRAGQLRHMQQLILVQQQAAALNSLNEDPESMARIDPDNMTYEQLLELGEKIGSVSKGLTSAQIAVSWTRHIVASCIPPLRKTVRRRH